MVVGDDKTSFKTLQSRGGVNKEDGNNIILGMTKDDLSKGAKGLRYGQLYNRF